MAVFRRSDKAKSGVLGKLQFIDGNGRTSRLLSTLCLYRTGYDFKRLFTISEYYDRDRLAFYKAIQSVRDSCMDLTGWLEFYTDGLSTQMCEVTEKGQRVFRCDVLVNKHALNQRQGKILDFLMENGESTIKSIKEAFDEIPRRTLQRDLKQLVDLDLVDSKGATHQLVYLLSEKGL